MSLADVVEEAKARHRKLVDELRQLKREHIALLKAHMHTAADMKHREILHKEAEIRGASSMIDVMERRLVRS